MDYWVKAAYINKPFVYSVAVLQVFHSFFGFFLSRRRRHRLSLVLCVREREPPCSIALVAAKLERAFPINESAQMNERARLKGQDWFLSSTHLRLCRCSEEEVSCWLMNKNEKWWLFCKWYSFWIKSYEMCYLYANYIRISSPRDSSKLQEDFHNILKWASANGIGLNINKCNIISFIRNRQPCTFYYCLDNMRLHRVSEIKDLLVFTLILVFRLITM